MKKTKYNWLLSFPGYWYTKEGYKLSSIERPARCGYGWYKFKNYEFEARGVFQAQLEAEELIVKDLASFKKALDSVNN
ncbi:hypothetical protein [Oceanobacillus sp. FSL H7-0719]|uniref:hypothetical protein n=1 Tax=Oceanobacillus sp. FSL H7-0719 TaxID=2954507 RepID=UPI0032474DEC